MESVSLLVRNARVFNSYLKKFIPGDVYILGEKFYYIDRNMDASLTADRTIDAGGQYMIPGLVDVHMHIESSMMTPGTFGHFLAGCGVTTIVSEPHEMANVKGIRGILEMIQAGEDSPVDIYYGIPSSVPSTRTELETTGGIIDCTAMKRLLREKDVVCVGEIMNYRQIILENDLEISKFLDYLKQEHPGYVIEGHCPSLKDLDLAKFLYLGINGDHTEHDLEEVRQRIENGMFFEIQDKMLKPDVLNYIIENQLFEYCAFVTDDTMADILWKEGQLNRVVEKAIEAGFPLEQAIYCASYTASRRMHLYDRGVIAPGCLADFSLLEDPAKLQPTAVYKNGQEIFCRETSTPEAGMYRFPRDFYESVHLPEITPDLFRMPVSRFMDGPAPEHVVVRTIEIQERGTQTKEKLVTMPVRDGYIDWKDSGCLLAMVLERHGKNGNISYGFLSGACHSSGTAATTYFHDHHNLFVAGDNEDDMLLAVNRIRALQGGYLTAKNGRILEELPLPICGILSDRTVAEIGSSLCKIRNSLKELGYRNPNPIMSFGTLGLPVSPALKLTDRGLVDVKESALVPLITSVQ